MNSTVEWSAEAAFVTLIAMDGENQQTDEQLLERFNKGSVKAFETLYNRYRQSLYLYLLRTAASAAEAEDVYQEVWSRVIHNKFEISGGSLRAYLFRVARNLQIDLQRRQRIRLVADSLEPDDCADNRPAGDERAHAEDCGRRLLSEVGRLPVEQREAFMLKEEGGLTLEQIAELVSAGRETVKSRLRYALKRLRQALEDCL